MTSYNVLWKGDFFEAVESEGKFYFIDVEDWIYYPVDTTDPKECIDRARFHENKKFS